MISCSSIENANNQNLSNLAEQEPCFPKVEWEKIEDPQSIGFKSDVEAIVREKLQSMKTTSMVIAVGGKILCDYGDPTELSYIASVRKSVLSILYGPYVEEGVINLTDTLETLAIDDIKELLESEKQATIYDLISSRSGIYHNPSNAGDDSASAAPRGTKKPGECFLYNNWDFNAAGTIFEQLSNKNIYDALKDDLALPIGMQDFDQSLQLKCGNEKKSKHLAYHMWLSARDMARIGHLMLNNGNWEGNQVTPAAWVEEVTATVTPFEEITAAKIQKEGLFNFGLMWWVWRNDPNKPWLEGAYTARGAFGQYISIFPKVGVVIAHKTSTNHDSEEVQEQWKRCIIDSNEEVPEDRSSVSMGEYMDVIETLFSCQLN